VKKRSPSKVSFDPNQFQKTPSGIQGLDEITNGGLPKGRPTLLCGTAGCGKTLFAMEFLVCGVEKYKEPGVFVSFEESEEDLTENVASLHFDLKKLASQKKLLIEHVLVERSHIEETGEYDLEGLFVRLNHAIDSIGAKRVVLDTIETLFSGLKDEAILRSELKRLFQWLKDKGVTAIITGERGEGTLTRHGIEEYVSDCVILLDQRIIDEISTRRMRVIKYRGSVHGTNEVPFLIDEEGISVLPIASLGLTHPGTNKRVSTGIAELDSMLGGKGYTRGSSVLISGTAGTGKTSLAAAFAIETCRRGERCLLISFEESPGQLSQNMLSIGLDFRPWIQKGLLEIFSTRPSLHGLEMHLLDLHKRVNQFKPKAVVLDPLTSLLSQGRPLEILSMLTRMIDLLKSHGITGVFTSLVSSESGSVDTSQVGVSSLIDTWIVVREIEDNQNRRTRGLYIVKSRGTAHSNEVQKLVLSNKGIRLLPVQQNPVQGHVPALNGSRQSKTKAHLRMEA
jgi:circadian clock protein KaiC